MKAVDASNEFVPYSELIYTDYNGKFMPVTFFGFDGTDACVHEPTVHKMMRVSPDNLKYPTDLDFNKIKVTKPEIFDNIEDPENLTQRQLHYLVHRHKMIHVWALDKKHRAEREALIGSYSALF